MSLADKYFREEAAEIIDGGFMDSDYAVRPQWLNEDGTKTLAHTKKIFGAVRSYDLAEEFPILTLRNAPFKYAVKETLWIFQKKSNNVNDLGSHNWDAWADENGSIGKTYGYENSVKFDFPEGRMDQVDYVLYKLKSQPMDRRMIIQLFRPEHIGESGLPPCLCSYYFDVAGDRLNMLMVMRSGDFLAAAGPGESDEIGAAVLLGMMARSSGYKPGALKVVVSNLHIYDRHIPIVQRICGNESYPAPKLWINPDKTDFYSFTPDDFRLIGYEKTKLEEKIPVAV